MGKSWKRMRREAILAEHRVAEQLEAILDSLAGNPTKLDHIRANISEIKKLYPKPAAEAQADARAADHVGFWRRRADELEKAGKTTEALKLRLEKGVIAR